MARRDSSESLQGGAVHVPRSRGAISGIVLLALGAWGALIPFVGSYFNFAFTPDKAWYWTGARWWLEVLPGAVTVLGALLLLLSANRVTGGLGAWLGVAGGAWFIVGPELASLLHLGSPGTPTGSSTGLRALESLAFFAGLGALIMFFAATVLGRLSVRSVRDLRAAQRREARTAQEQDAAYAAGARAAYRDTGGEERYGPAGDAEGGDGQGATRAPG